MTSTKVRFPASVVKVLAADRVAINRGSVDGVAIRQRFVVYALDTDVIRDPATGEELGRLELPKGHGIIIHVQDRLAILYNDSASFAGPKVGDFAKPV